MNTGIEFLVRLKEVGYFEQAGFNPSLVFEVSQNHLGIDVSSHDGNERLASFINGLVRGGLIQFEYSTNPDLHPKDILDHWRIVLTRLGARRLAYENA